jgi:hypothetical protein
MPALSMLAWFDRENKFPGIASLGNGEGLIDAVAEDMYLFSFSLRCGGTFELWQQPIDTTNLTNRGAMK